MENVTLFKELEGHFRSRPTELHFYILVKSIATLFLKVRVHYLNKVLSANNVTAADKKNTRYTFSRRLSKPKRCFLKLIYVVKLVFLDVFTVKFVSFHI